MLRLIIFITLLVRLVFSQVLLEQPETSDCANEQKLDQLLETVAKLESNCRKEVNVHLHFDPETCTATVDHENSDISPVVNIHLNDSDNGNIDGRRKRKNHKKSKNNKHHRTECVPDDSYSRDSSGYLHAHCAVKPNTLMVEGEYREVHGNVHFVQRERENLTAHVNLEGFDWGHGRRHGFHVHQYGDLSLGCESAGGHWNPNSFTHGAPADEIRHAGDFVMLYPDENGHVRTTFTDRKATLFGSDSIIGRALVIHASPDDFGRGGNDESKTTGNAGHRLACCVIAHANPNVHIPGDASHPVQEETKHREQLGRRWRF